MNTSIDQLYIAYRKAKKEAFGDSNCAHGLKFATYERDLHNRLNQLRSELTKEQPDWHSDRAFLGELSFVTKNRAKPDFRKVVDPSVDYMVISALWLLEVGHCFDERLHAAASANRLARGLDGGVNVKCANLFEPYLDAGNRWRRGAILSAKSILRSDSGAILLKIDLKGFQYSVDARFLLDQKYLRQIEVELTEEQHHFTKYLIDSFSTMLETEVGIPAGLSASRLIGNVLLIQFDQKLATDPAIDHYGRYVDDVMIVLQDSPDLQSDDQILGKIAGAASPFARLLFSSDRKNSNSRFELAITLPYGGKSQLRFAGSKQALFRLEKGSNAPEFEQILNPSPSAFSPSERGHR